HLLRSVVAFRLERTIPDIGRGWLCRSAQLHQKRSRRRTGRAGEARLRDGVDQHGPRVFRYVVGDRPSGSADRLPAPVEASCHCGREETHQGVLRPGAKLLVLQLVLEWWTPGID